MAPTWNAMSMSKPPAEMSGFIFICKGGEDMKKMIREGKFRMKANEIQKVKRIKKGMTIFLYDYSEMRFHGIWKSKTPGYKNEAKKYAATPAEIQVERQNEYNSLPIGYFKTILHYSHKCNNTRFYTELDGDQVQKMAEVFNKGIRV
ncbi:B2 protein-like [Silene latifolia]|uniref:B2 protein-like n=1 Tax=Silene latifolia TaxID=37657 RepID=UPI003D770805